MAQTFTPAGRERDMHKMGTVSAFTLSKIWNLNFFWVSSWDTRVQNFRWGGGGGGGGGRKYVVAFDIQINSNKIMNGCVRWEDDLYIERV
jgi:hypothetical protein